MILEEEKKISRLAIPLKERQGKGAAFWGKCAAFLKRDWIENTSYASAFLMDFAGIAAQLATFYFISKMIENGSGSFADYRSSYFAFVLIGIAFSSYQAASLHSFTGALMREMEGGTLEAILATPTSPAAVMIAGSLWSFLFTSVRVAIYLFFGFLFGIDFSRANFFAAGILMILTITSLSGIGILSAGIALLLKKGDPVVFLMNGMSKLFAGVYFPLSILPSWAQSFSQLIPLTHSLEGMRKALLNGAGLQAVSKEIAVLSAFSLFFIPVALVCFRSAVGKAQRDGALGFR